MYHFGYCLNASTIATTPVLQQIEVAGRAGYGAIELWFEHVDRHLASGGSLHEVRRALDDHNLSVPTMIYFGGWIEAAESEWRSVRDGFARRLEMAATLGAPYVIACPPPASGDVNVGAQRYRELVELGTGIGALPAMEFLGFVEQFNTIESALEIVERAGHPLGSVVLDPFHIFRGGGSMGSITKVRADQIAVAHFNDAPRFPAREQQGDAHRVWPGDGSLDLHAYLSMLRGVGYDRWLSLELFREEFWAMDPLEVARSGFDKMRSYHA